MRHLLSRPIVSLLTFFIGVAAVNVWLTSHHPLALKAAGSSEAGGRSSCFTVSMPGAPPGMPARLYYFPPEMFASEERIGDSIAQGLASYLTFIKEPPFLSLPECVDESYRFIWLRSFHPPVTIRVWREGGESFLAVKQSEVMTWRDEHERPQVKLGELSIAHSRSLTEAEWATFNNLLRWASYWETPVFDGEWPNDGAAWVLEGNNGRQHKIVYRNSPTAGPYYEACLYLLDISGLKIDKSSREFY